MRISDYANFMGMGGGINSLFGSTSSQGGFIGNAALYKGFSEVNSIGYKRMLKQYFAEDDKKTDSSEEEKNVNKWEQMQKDEKATANAKLVKELKEATGSVMSAADTLTAVDKNNKNVLFEKDKETINKAITNFATEYNDLISHVSKNSFSNTKMSSLYNQLTSISKASQYALRDVGIKVNRDGSLTVDQDKLAAADTDKLEDVFGKKGSFADRAGEKAEYVNKNTDRYKNDTYGGYSKNLDYNNVFGSGGLYNNFF